MTLDALIMLTGAFVALLPFLGFPSNWDTVFYFLGGILIIGLGIVVRRRSAHSRDGDAFLESTPTYSREVSHEEA